MNVNEWNGRYLESIEVMQSKIPEIKGVVTAYNSNIDAIIHVGSGDFEKVLETDVDLRKNFVAKLGKPLDQISSREDLLVGLINCIKSGTGQEWIIKSRDVFTWFESRFKYDQLRMGGQAGIAANTLAKLNVPNVIAHVSSLPEAQSSLFFDNVKIPTKKNGRVLLENPMKADRSDDEKMVHYVFEFDKGTRIELDGNRFEAPRANRFVATWDPRNTKLEIDPAFLELKIGGEVDRAIIAGYHLLQPSYEDGSTHIDNMRRAVKQVKGWKEENPGLFIHLEMGDSKYEEIYASVLDLVSPFIDSIGMNENELLKASSALGLAAPNAREPFDGVTAFETARMILETLNVRTILVHTLDFSLIVVKKEEEYSIGRIKDLQSSILFGALLAAVRAVTCGYNDVEKVRKEAGNPLLSLSQKGMNEHECLADFVEKSYGASRKDFLNRGYIELADCYVTFAVSKVTDKPATTAGLGDSLIAGYILGVK